MANSNCRQAYNHSFYRLRSETRYSEVSQKEVDELPKELEGIMAHQWRIMDKGNQGGH